MNEASVGQLTAAKIKRWNHRHAPIERYAKRGDLGEPARPDQNASRFDAAVLYREHWRKRDNSAYHRLEYDAAAEALRSHSPEIWQIVETVVLHEKSAAEIGADLVADKNHARRKAVVIARLHVGLGFLDQYFSQMGPVEPAPAQGSPVNPK